MDDFPLAISVVYESTPPGDRGLRDLAVETSGRHIEKLLSHENFCSLLRKTPEFAADLVPFVCTVQAEVHEYRCPNCEKTFRAELSATGKSYCPCCSQGRSDWYSYRLN